MLLVSFIAKPVGVCACACVSVCVWECPTVHMYEHVRQTVLCVFETMFYHHREFPYLLPSLSHSTV